MIEPMITVSYILYIYIYVLLQFADDVQYPVLNYRMYEWDLGFYADDDDVLYVCVQYDNRLPFCILHICILNEIWVFNAYFQAYFYYVVLF